jgi:hypothetical protein
VFLINEGFEMSTEEKAQKERENLLNLADDMAEAATDFKGQGYRLFIAARQRFKECLDSLSIK